MYMCIYRFVRISQSRWWCHGNSGTGSCNYLLSSTHSALWDWAITWFLRPFLNFIKFLHGEEHTHTHTRLVPLAQVESPPHRMGSGPVPGTNHFLHNFWETVWELAFDLQKNNKKYYPSFIVLNSSTFYLPTKSASPVLDDPNLRESSCFWRCTDKWSLLENFYIEMKISLLTLQRVLFLASYAICHFTHTHTHTYTHNHP